MNHETLMAQGPAECRVMPLRTLDVVLAILAVDTEAARRGEMFPQTSDEQCEDRRAVNRVVGMLRWYEENTGCARLKGWPSMTVKVGAGDTATDGHCTLGKDLCNRGGDVPAVRAGCANWKRHNAIAQGREHSERPAGAEG